MLCDCHVHVFMDGINFRKAYDRHIDQVDESVIHQCLKAYQECGITYLRDGGDALGVSLRAKELAAEYGINYRSPIFAIHKKGCYGHIVGRGFDTIEEYAALVKEAKRLGADFIKIMTTGIMEFDHAGVITGNPLEASLVKQMVHIAHEEGLSVMSHTNGSRAIREAVEAGVDSIEHGNYQDEASIRALADSSTVWVPTLVTVRNLSGKGRFCEEEVLKIMKTQTDAVCLAYKKGVMLATGTDGGAWMVPHGTSLRQEYDAFEEILGSHEDVKQYLDKGNQEIIRRF